LCNLRPRSSLGSPLITQARRTGTTPQGPSAAGGWGKELHGQPLDNFEDAPASAKTNGEASIDDEASLGALTVSDQT
jgi:hypothetical protein